MLALIAGKENDSKSERGSKEPHFNHDLINLPTLEGLEGPEDESRLLQTPEKFMTLPDGAVTISNITLGRGAFGLVYVGKYQGRPVAVKEFSPTSELGLTKMESLQAFEWETGRLSTLHHPNLVRFYGVYQKNNTQNQGKIPDDCRLCMVMELCHRQTLAKRLQKEGGWNSVVLPISASETSEHPYDVVDLLAVDDQLEAEIGSSTRIQADVSSHLPVNGPVSNNSSSNDVLLPETPPIGWPTFWRVALDMAHGLAYLHEQGTLHRDLKPDNVLFDLCGRAKLADLGVAQVDGLVQSSEVGIVSKNFKDYGYAAPEEFTLRVSTTKSDMFSYGLVLCEMLQGRPLGDCYNREHGKLETIPSSCLRPVRDIIESCWDIDPEKRPTARAVIGLLERCHEECGVSKWNIVLPRLEQELEPQQEALRQYVPSLIEQQQVDPDANIQTALNNFLIDEKNRVLVILGEGGVGKSLSTYDLAQQLIDRERQRSHDDVENRFWLPVFIRPTISLWHHAALQAGCRQALTYYGLPQDSMGSINTHSQRLVFIFDGYDELAGNVVGNLPTTLGVADFPNAKLIISSRPTSDLMSVLHEKLGLNESCIVYHLLPFTEHQRLNLLQNCLHWSAEQQQLFSAQLSKAPELASSLKNPFVLNIFAQSWETQKKRSFSSLSTHEIYDTFIHHWVDTYSPLLPVPLHKQLLGDHPLKSAQDWLMKSAFMMAKDETFSLPLDAMQNTAWSSVLITSCLNEHASQQFQARLDGITAKQQALLLAINPEEQATLTQELKALERRALMSLPQYQSLLLSRAQRFFHQAPLKQRNGQFQFIHKSLWEYCTASGIRRSLAHATDEPSNALQLGLTPYFILQDASVISFLQSLTSPQDRSHWESWLEASKHNTGAAPVAACAITALNGLQMMKRKLQSAYEFPRDLRGIRIPGADLRGAMLDGIQFDRADLSKVQFTNAWLANSSVSRAQLDSVQFGEYPSLLLQESVDSCCYSPDGSQFLVDQGEEIHLYDVGTQKLVRKLTGHTLSVRHVVFSLDGKFIASGSDDNTVRLWDPATGILLRRFEGHTGSVNSVAFSPDSEFIASGSGDQSVRVWDAVRGSLLLKLKGHANEVTSVTFSPDGKYISFGGYGESVPLWDSVSGVLLQELRHTGMVNSVAFSPDNRVIASSGGSSVSLWELKSGELLRSLKGQVDSVMFDSNSRYMASRSDQSIHLWDAVSGALLCELKGHTNTIKYVTFSPDGRSIASAGGEEKAVRFWATTTGTLLQDREGHTKPVRSIALSPNGRYITSGSLGESVWVWDAASGTSLCELKGNTDSIYSVAFSSDSKHIAAGGVDRLVRIWDAASGLLLQELKRHTETVSSLAFSLDGTLLASGSHDQSICLWNGANRTLFRQLKTKHITSVAFSPNSKLIASGSWGGSAQLWDVASGNLLRQLRGHNEDVRSIVFSPDGSYIASSSHDKSVVIWDVAYGDLLQKLKGHNRAVKSAVFSPDSRYIASASGHNHGGVGVYAIGLWDVGSGTLLQMTPTGSGTNSIHWSTSRQGSFLATGHDDSSVRYWKVVGTGQSMRLQLVWSSARLGLMVEQLHLGGAQGLSNTNLALLKQRGAIGERSGTEDPFPESSSIEAPFRRLESHLAGVESYLAGVQSQLAGSEEPSGGVENHLAGVESHLAESKEPSGGE